MNWNDFINANREKIFRLAEENTVRNSDGRTVISCDDTWFYDNIWDVDFAQLDFYAKEALK